MKIQDFSKLYGALFILSIVVIIRPGKPALEIISQPILPFSLLAFFLHRGSYQIIPGKGLVNVALGLVLISFLIFTMLPQMELLRYSLWAGVHLLMGIYYISVIRRPIPAAVLGGALLPLLLAWVYVLAWYPQGKSLDYMAILYFLVLSVHVGVGMLTMLRLQGWHKFLALALLFWLLADGLSVLFPEIKNQAIGKALVYGARAIALYGAVFAPLALRKQREGRS